MVTGRQILLQMLMTRPSMTDLYLPKGILKEEAYKFEVSLYLLMNSILQADNARSKVDYLAKLGESQFSRNIQSPTLQLEAIYRFLRDEPEMILLQLGLINTKQ